jgi:exosortase
VAAWRRARTESRSSSGDLRGLWLLIPGLLLYLAGSAAAEIFSIRVSFPLVLTGVLMMLSGKTRALSLAFPVGFFLLAIPLPAVLYAALTSPLQILSTKIAAGISGGLGIMVSREGNVLRVGGASLGVAEACSGLRSLVSYGAVAILLARFLQKDWLSRVVLVLASVLVAVFSNSCRLVVSAVGTLAYGPGFTSGKAHTATGVVVFILGLLALFGISELLRWKARRTLLQY